MVLVGRIGIVGVSTAMGAVTGTGIRTAAATPSLQDAAAVLLEGGDGDESVGVLEVSFEIILAAFVMAEVEVGGGP